MSCRSFKTEVFFTLPICGLVVCLACTSLITERWVTGKATSANDTSNIISYNYGLFKGVKTVKVSASAARPLKLNVVCEGGRCMFTCADKKKDDLDDILSDCPYTNNYGDRYMCVEGNTDVNMGFSNKAVCSSETYNSTIINRNEEEMMMLYGPWVAAIFFLILGLVFTVVASIFSVLNAFSNPIEMIVGVYGLVVWNSIAAASYFLVVCIYGGEYDAHLKKVAPISNILRAGDINWVSKGQAGLGYSYWVVLVSFFCHLINIGIVGYYIYRKYKPKKKVVDVGYEEGPVNMILY